VRRRAKRIPPRKNARRKQKGLAEQTACRVILRCDHSRCAHDRRSLSTYDTGLLHSDAALSAPERDSFTRFAGSHGMTLSEALRAGSPATTSKATPRDQPLIFWGRRYFTGEIGHSRLTTGFAHNFPLRDQQSRTSALRAGPPHERASSPRPILLRSWPEGARRLVLPTQLTKKKGAPKGPLSLFLPGVCVSLFWRLRTAGSWDIKGDSPLILPASTACTREPPSLNRDGIGPYIVQGLPLLAPKGEPRSSRDTIGPQPKLKACSKLGEAVEDGHLRPMPIAQLQPTRWSLMSGPDGHRWRRWGGLWPSRVSHVSGPFNPGFGG